MPLTNAGAEQLLEGGLDNTTRYFSLFVGDPSGAGVEVSAAGYVRLARSAAQMTVVGNELSVDAATWEDSAQASWGTPTYVGLHSAAAGGTLLAYAVVSPGLSEIAAGTEVFVEDGDITVTIPLS